MVCADDKVDAEIEDEAMEENPQEQQHHYDQE